MERWTRKVAVVTGASSGIGAAIVVDLVKANMIVIGLARRDQRVNELRSKIPENCAGELHSFKCDVQREEDVKAAFKWIEEQFGGVDVLINNAGVVIRSNLLDSDNMEQIKSVIDTNVYGVIYCTREAFQSMKKRDAAGHIVTINSICGHKVPYFADKSDWPSLNIYPSSKFAVSAMTEVLRQELQREKSKVKVTVRLINALTVVPNTFQSPFFLLSLKEH